MIFKLAWKKMLQRFQSLLELIFYIYNGHKRVHIEVCGKRSSFWSKEFLNPSLVFLQLAFLMNTVKTVNLKFDIFEA